MEDKITKNSFTFRNEFKIYTRKNNAFSINLNRRKCTFYYSRGIDGRKETRNERENIEDTNRHPVKGNYCQRKRDLNDTLFSQALWCNFKLYIRFEKNHSITALLSILAGIKKEMQLNISDTVSRKLRISNISFTGSQGTARSLNRLPTNLVGDACSPNLITPGLIEAADN